MGKDLSGSFMLYVQGAIDCQLTVHYQKPEKSGLKRRKSKRSQKRRQARKIEADATTRNA
jgi:hypothetical protein